MRTTLVFCVGLCVASGLTAAKRAVALDLPAGCGSDQVQYKVKTDKKQSAQGTAPGDKARFVFLQTLDGEVSPAPVSRFAVDGSWVGADKGASYFVLDVTPGAHKVCASRQSSIKLEKANLGVSALTAEAGKTYYFEFKTKRTEVGSPEMRTGTQGVPGSSMTAKPADTVDSASLSPLDADAGATEIKKLPLAISETK